MSQNILDRILETKRKEVAALLQRTSLEELRAQAGQSPRPRNFFKALSKKPHRRVNFIAEVKRASPSAGLICEDFDPVDIARQYEQAGADALSVLTDEQYFRGSLDSLRKIRQAVELPILRKDFIIDAAQVYEARAAGADAILLIAAALTPGALSDLMILAAELKMTALVEVHNVEEMLQVRSMIGVPHAAYSLLGINNRDLITFHVDLKTTARLAELADNATIISESGIKTREDVEYLRSVGVKGILVGETLMRSDDIAAAVEELIGPAR